MAAVCIVVNTTPQTVLVMGSPPPVMRGFFADGMDAAGHEQLATRHFEMCAASVPLAKCWWMSYLRPVSTHPPQTEVFESNVDDPHHLLAPNKGNHCKVQYLLVYK